MCRERPKGIILKGENINIENALLRREPDLWEIYPVRFPS